MMQTAGMSAYVDTARQQFVNSQLMPVEHSNFTSCDCVHTLLAVLLTVHTLQGLGKTLMLISLIATNRPGVVLPPLLQPTDAAAAAGQVEGDAGAAAEEPPSKRQKKVCSGLFVESIECGLRSGSHCSDGYGLPVAWGPWHEAAARHGKTVTDTLECLVLHSS